MRPYFFIALPCLVMIGCKFFGDRLPPSAPVGYSELTAALADSTKATTDILNNYFPSLLKVTEQDTFFAEYGFYLIPEDSTFRQILAGNLIGEDQTIAVEIHHKNASINFYSRKKGAWQLSGTEKPGIPLYKIWFEDLNGDHKKEIITATFWNMNGNSWMEVYCQSAESGSVKYAGSFSTSYEVDKKRGRIHETYEGSWYMDTWKKIYEWKGEKLIPVKQIVLAHDTADIENGVYFLEYYENPTDDFKGLKLIFREHYIEDERQSLLWDHFFLEN